MPACFSFPVKNESLETVSTFSMASLRNLFERFAAHECRNHSPLYEKLCRQIAADESVLRICTLVRDGQPVPNAFLASVHFLLLKNSEASLAQYYPSVSGQTSDGIPFDVFKSFVLEHQEAITQLLCSRIVQTNVLTRCNYLMPVFSSILSGTSAPATIIDIGTSAGLTLNFDHYTYYYNDKKQYGDGRVRLDCKILGEALPVLKPFRSRLRKLGIDQHVINLSHPDEVLWLKALVWPDQTQRFLQMSAALELPELGELELAQGSTMEDFRRMAESIDPSGILILYATHVLYQFPPHLLQSFYHFLDVLGRTRDFYFVSAEATEAIRSKFGIDHTGVVLTAYKEGQKEERLVAETDGHGNWMRWTGLLGSAHSESL